MAAGQIILFIPSCIPLQKKHILILYILIKIVETGLVLRIVDLKNDKELYNKKLFDKS